MRIPSILLFAIALAAPALGGQAARPEQGKLEDKKPEVVAPAPPASVTQHKITVGGRTISYMATASTIDLKNEKNELIARMFSVAYVDSGASDATKRPVTFVFNGGPGSSSMWLHMGSFGPVRVRTTDAAATPPPPYTVGDNEETLLDKSDLVFIDAVGTGYSRIEGKGEPKDFYGTDPDVASFAQFIERWLTANGRWNSPKFLLGESYGTTRAAALLNAMQTRGVAFNGAILLSSYLNAWDDFNGPPFANDLPYALYLPTMAATVYYHGKVDPKPASLAAFVEEARQFALGEYAHALAQGSRLKPAERDAVVAKLRRFTAMPEAMIRNADLRILPNRFEKELLRGDRRSVGRLDARFKSIDRDAAGESPEYDSADAAFAAAFVAALNGYMHDTLKYVREDLYRPNNYAEVGRAWDDHHSVDGHRAPMPDVAADLRIAMSKNPNLKIFSANGYFDFATPFFQTEYSLAHMGLDPALEKNISYGYYEAGHMVYVNDAARRQMKADAAKFYDQAVGTGAPAARPSSEGLAK